MESPTRRPRGPRTSSERASDAAKRTATLFEKLPSSPFADAFLKPLALLLRFETGSTYLEPGPRLRDMRHLTTAEREFHDQLRRFEEVAEFMPVRDALRVEQMCEGVRRDLRKTKERMALAAAEDGDDA